jgi:PKD repeat protein
METNTATTVEAKLSNIGKNDETNITVQFLVNQGIEDSMLIDFLAAGELTWVSFPWTPLINGVYTVGIKAVPLPNENITSNNLDEKEVIVTMYPIADAGPDQESFSGRTVNFDGSNSYDPDGTIVEHKWEFGDGTVGYGQTTSHAYSTYGVYNVILTVKDNEGAVGTDTATVTIWQDGHDLSIWKVLSPRNIHMGSTKSVAVWVENVGSYDDYGLLALTITAPDGTKTTLTKIIKDRDGTSFSIDSKIKVYFYVTFNQRGAWNFHTHLDVSDSNGNINPFPLKDCNPSNDDAEPGYATNCR